MKHDFKSLAHPTAGVPHTCHAYRNESGKPVLIANRYEPEGRGKFFLPFDIERGEWKAPQDRPLYNLDKITSADPNQIVLFVEGEKCADALTQLGYLATTTFGGCKALKKSDLSPLAGRTVVLWPDFDEPGFAYVREAAERLNIPLRENTQILPISESLIREICASQNSITLLKGWDAADALKEGWGKNEIDALIRAVTPSEKSDQSEPLSLIREDQSLIREEQRSDTPLLDGLELWKTPQDETYATLRRNGHFEHWPTGSKTFRNYLSFAHFQIEGKVPSATALEDRRRMMEGVALFEGETHPVFSRIAAVGRTIFLDLGDADWQAVAITAEGWQVVSHPMARFRRSASMDALPVPEKNSDGIELLRPFLNVASDDDFRMLVAWLVGCFHPKGPYPILILSGEQGSSKSTTAQILRSLIDPANPASRSTPSSEQDLVIAAKHNHVLSFDNLSTIRPTMADAFCRIATGGGFGTRKLHTDTDEVLFNATRPVLLNGIPDLASRPDLADRAIGVNLPVISPEDRRTLGSFNREFAKAAPLILGTLLDAVSMALSRIDSVSLTEAPRMADFAKWVTAAEPALGWPQESFLESYAANRQQSDRASVENNPVALAILKLLKEDVRWSGTMTELKTVLRNRYPSLTDDPYSFPRQENKLSAAIRRIQPPLRRMGVVLEFCRRGQSGDRIIRIERG